MSKTRRLVLAVSAGLALAVLAIPATAEPRDQRRVAGWESLPPPVGMAAEPWQMGEPSVVRKVPWVAAQQPPLEILPPVPDEAAQSMFMPPVQKGELPCGPACGCPQQRRIAYRDHRRPPRKGDCLCAPPIQTVLAVPDGSCCQCAVEVPVCIPACCVDAPQVDIRRGLLGRARVLYRWCCGFEVEVVFCGNGNLIVHYDQR